MTANDSGYNLMCWFGEKDISVRLIFVRVMHGLHHAVYQNRDVFRKNIHQEPPGGSMPPHPPADLYRLFCDIKQTDPVDSDRVFFFLFLLNINKHP